MRLAGIKRPLPWLTQVTKHGGHSTLINDSDRVLNRVLNYINMINVDYHPDTCPWKLHQIAKTVAWEISHKARKIYHSKIQKALMQQQSNQEINNYERIEHTMP